MLVELVIAITEETAKLIFNVSALIKRLSLYVMIIF